VKIYRYNSEPEAQKIKFLLESQNIPCEIHSFENWGYDGALRGAMGMGEIIVPDEFSDKAKEIIVKFVKEEMNKTPEQDMELKSIKLKRNIEKFKTLIYVIYIAFITCGYFLLFHFKGIIAIMVFLLLLITVIRATFYVRKDIEKAKEELKNLKNAPK